MRIMATKTTSVPQKSLPSAVYCITTALGKLSYETEGKKAMTMVVAAVVVIWLFHHHVPACYLSFFAFSKKLFVEVTSKQNLLKL